MIEKDRKYKRLQDRFQQEVLNDIINTNHLNSKYFGNPEKRNHTSLSLCSCNMHYLESDYYLKDESKFIHFSSEKKLESILESQQLRLYNLSHQNDDQEFKFAATVLGESENASVYSRRKQYSLSMCKMNVEDDLTMWRLYANNTQGVGIVLKIVNNPIYWMNYHLSKIYYGNIRKLELYNQKKKDFEKKNNFKFNLSLDRFLAFHKSDQFQVEKEVRIIYYHKKPEKNFSSLPKSVNVDSLPEYFTLDILNSKKANDNNKFSSLQKPIIKIEEIILGPNFSKLEIIDKIEETLDKVIIRKSNLEGIFKI